MSSALADARISRITTEQRLAEHQQALSTAAEHLAAVTHTDVGVVIATRTPGCSAVPRSTRSHQPRSHSVIASLAFAHIRTSPGTGYVLIAMPSRGTALPHQPNVRR